MSTYGSLLKTRGVGRIIAAQLVARFPGGMLSLAFLMHVERIHESYGAAGLVLAATSIGQAVAGPLTSRWMGVWGMRPVLILTSVVCTVAVVAVALGDESTSVPVFMVLGLVAGLANPPVQPAVRTIYPKMVNSKQLTPLFSLDASAQEIIWVLGPVIATFLAIQVDTSAGILVAAAFLVGGGAWFISSPELGRVRIPRSKRRFGVVLGRPPVLLSTVVGFLLIAACAAIEAGVVAVFGHGGPEAGFVLAIFAVGSLIGGLSLGHIPISPWAMARRMAIILVGTAVAAVSMNVVWLSVFLFLAGVGIAPALAVLFAVVSSSVRFSDTAEAYGWVGTGQLIGAALGSAAAGFVIDAQGAQGAFVVAAALLAVGAAIAAVFHRHSPDLRGRDAGPIPDTEPVPVMT
ncbi:MULTISPECIES: MFS transporter [Clavibacter]|uniref:MFS transporter n=2 Tax=Clavibacter TaxID=1573 RepID=A0A399NXP2_9MICO|nr:MULTISPECIES: MFS transporter [Clavibacter]KDP92265.1 major facilitator transporter [Clavibacter cf. michiganensis LMG 26808]RII98169.1 MFS transporter [Clavibacter michiganensis]UKF24543.1 MFS transporter [Clavibacter sp. A6099]